MTTCLRSLPLVCFLAAAGWSSPSLAEDSAPPMVPTLPGGLRVGGKFDAAYERAGLGDGLSEGHNVLRNYHHFLFLSRQGQGDPIGFNAELLDRAFYELTARIAPVDRSYRFQIRAGKILVPFGPEPLYHKSYGGLSGFDQQMLPVVWAQLGANVQARYTRGRLALANDIYAVSGHALTAPGATLDLQRDLAPADKARIAVGDRLAAAFGPVTVWYSFYANSLGFGRRLILQAVDATLWHPVPLPVLDRLALGFGAIRGDISGGDDGAGGPGKDYFHFADYLWLRLYAWEWLYVQARTGLYTFDNRRGTYLDRTRLDERDSSHHNVALVAQRWGASVSAGYYWNFEKANERPDDFFRLLVSYDF